MALNHDAVDSADLQTATWHIPIQASHKQLKEPLQGHNELEGMVCHKYPVFFYGNLKVLPDAQDESRFQQFEKENTCAEDWADQATLFI